MLDKAPRILIISETFKVNTGGGITLSNLFKNYPKNCLANAIDAKEVIHINSDEICNNFYSLGSNEKKVLKVFSFLQKKYYSGKYVYENKENKILHKRNKGQTIREIVVDYFFLFLHFIGIYHLLYRYEISADLKKWIDDFNPEYIYTQLSSRELIKFTDNLLNQTGASLAIHIMDDWPSTIGKNGLLKFYWHKRIDTEFRNLLDRADVLLSISTGMTNEYKKRYNKDFVPFHNPIEVNQWTPFSKVNLVVDPQNIIVLYAGRIGLGTSDSILEIANVIDQLNKEGFNISFHIQTTTTNSQIISKLENKSCVKFNPVVEYSELPKIFSKADLLVMPIDFSKEGINFLKYSMPTKASEYMISGTPILLYSDEKVTIVEHAKRFGWAYCVSNNSFDLLKTSIINILTNYDLRESLSKSAVHHALSYYDSNIVRELFRNKLSQSYK